MSALRHALANLKIVASILLYLREPLGPRGLEEARLLEVLSRKSSKQITHITADKFQPRLFPSPGITP